MDLNEQNLAFEFFNELIKPVLAQDKACTVMGCFINDSSLIETFLELVTTIRKFQHFEDYEANMESFKKAVIKTLNPILYEKLFESLMTNLNGYSSIKQILDLFKHRVAWLEDKISNFPDFSWRMPNATIAYDEATEFCHIKVEDFLRSNKQQMTYDGFNGVRCAKKFVSKNGGLKLDEGYSTEMSIEEKKNKFSVKIVKTKAYHQRQLEICKEQKAELAKIKSFNLNI